MNGRPPCRAVSRATTSSFNHSTRFVVPDCEKENRKLPIHLTLLMRLLVIEVVPESWIGNQQFVVVKPWGLENCTIDATDETFRILPSLLAFGSRYLTPCIPVDNDISERSMHSRKENSHLHLTIEENFMETTKLQRKEVVEEGSFASQCVRHLNISWLFCRSRI